MDRKSTEWTLMIQGDLDRNGSAFATAANMLSQNQYSPNILLTVAALATRGDILELGAGASSSPLLHRIAEAGKRGGVSSFLSPSSPSSSSAFHKYLLDHQAWCRQTLTPPGSFGWPTPFSPTRGTRCIFFFAFSPTIQPP